MMILSYKLFRSYKKNAWFVLRLIRFFSSLDIIENGKKFDIDYWICEKETVGRRVKKKMA